MRLLGKNLLEAFIKKHPGAKSSLLRWQKIIEESDYRNMVELRKTFPHKVRTVTMITFNIRQVIITHVLTHEEYDRGRWKDA